MTYSGLVAAAHGDPVCSCGAVFRVYVTPVMAAEDFMAQAEQN